MPFTLIHRLMARLHGGAASVVPPLPRPDQPLCLIGDIHGRSDLLDLMLQRIAQQPGGEDAHIIALGDLIDRGPDSAGVISRLMDEQATRPAHVTVLMGNHERLMLDFLADPVRNPRWLHFGAADTMRSYGIEPATDRPALAAEVLRNAMPQSHRDWLTNLPLYWEGDGLVAVHADADPSRPLSRQSEDVLLWGRDDFGRRRQNPPCWIAHGHVIQEQPYALSGRIALDTGAWKTGTLSAAWLDADGLRFIQVGAPA
ncbi:metallophosphoesterase [Paracoccus sp. TK19116]|uniref:Metallophosphoesterase n=1 Tax=Paracoccus albicereus TaxID=2922394 RepID=A0ABT1MQB3_9RHOB|nr:metallophosphoesterase [Paracoccus albicereus]MCQ0969696.1 metallophosphoesterase [Paracoccus albicereus]